MLAEFIGKYSPDSIHPAWWASKLSLFLYPLSVRRRRLSSHICRPFEDTRQRSFTPGHWQIYKTPTTYLGTYLILTRYTRGHPRFKFYTVTPGLQVPRWRFSHIPILSDNLKSAIMFGVSRTTRALRFNATRSFSSAPRAHAPAALKINADRLWKTLHQTCEWGAAHRYGEYVL